ncbi:MAG TPA: hypothetical protein VHD83_27630 [Puia sp.]|nr:hypothetical protein [Puia sp.]
MNAFLHSLLRFIRGTIHYRLLHRGPGPFSTQAPVVPINSYRFGTLPGRRRRGMSKKNTPGKIATLPVSRRSASSH